ncbi:MAG: hypothetical protein FD129_2129 [bacterium]|nr:MAG: hypothetical protein FD129_2129 [bacterium]
MNHLRLSSATAIASIVILCGLAMRAPEARAQDEASIQAPEDTTLARSVPVEKYYNGFDIVQTSRGSLNISGYGLVRYVNQLPGEQTFTDHLGRERTVKARNDINWHRTMIWFSGFFYTPKFRYTLTVWSLPTTQQALTFGFLQYTVSNRLTFGAGMAPNLTNRSMQGSHPFWAGSDRQMSEEFFRGGFSSGFFARGEAVNRLSYIASVNTNLSQLGVTATNDSRDLAYSGSLQWMPTTGEFGPRGGFGDLESHEQLATRFGASAGHAREDRAAPLGSAPNETQLRISDGVLLFEQGALADTVTVIKADYDNFAVDASFKYRGFTFQGEYYVRRLSNFLSTSPLPDDSITDTGFMAEAMHMVVPKKLGLYAAGGYVWDEFERHPWEVAVGASYYPMGVRTLRLNLHVIRIEKSPTSSNFGYYTAGQSGTTISLGADILL